MERSATWGRLGLALSDVGLRRAAPVVVLCGLVAIAYGPAIPNFFVSDDLDMLSGDASDLFSPTSGFGRFMPLAAALHRTAASVFGLNPVPAHAFQLLLHAAAVVLVYVLARQLLTVSSEVAARSRSRGASGH